MTEMYGKKLLAGVIGWPEKDVEQIITLKNNYRLIEKIQKDGSLRKTFAPNPELKKLQRRFLRYFLYRIFIGFDDVITGFRPGCSYINNAKKHALREAKFVLRLDLADAFPTVKTEYLKAIMGKILNSEIEEYKKGNYSFHPLFSNRKVKWFRKIIKNYHQPDLFCDPNQTISEFVDLILSFTTYKGILPQGAPTSPYLFDIVLRYSGLLQKIEKFLNERKISVSDDIDYIAFRGIKFTFYADDLTISSLRPIKKFQINDLIDLIEHESPFRVNRKKISYFQTDRISPLVTGLRLVRLIKEGRELDAVLTSQNLNKRQKKNLKRKILNREGKWIVNSVSLPKKNIKKIRGLIHRATYADPSNQKLMEQKIKGYISCLKPIYGGKMPNQILKPFQKFQISLQG